jgi:CRP-like cAMP-binding protein
MNAVAWGVVFASVNLVQIYRLLQERREVKFSVEEGQLFYRQFAPFGCEAILFQKLLKLAEWKSYKRGEVIVTENTPLDCIYILFRGTAAAVDPKKDGTELYTYSGGENGCIIGATALVDQTVRKHNYPNRIVAKESIRLVGFKTEKLRAFLQTDPSAEAALLHMAYVDLIGGLRRARQHTQKQELGEALHELKIMLVQSCADGVIQPQERKLIREFMDKHKITHSQLVALLQSEAIGWTEAEWSDGAKHSKILSSLSNGTAPLSLLFRPRREETRSV